MTQQQKPLSAPPLKLSQKALRTQEAAISALMAAAIGNPELINLAAGFVDDQTLPVTECRQIAQKLFADEQLGRRALQYDTTIGLAPLRAKLLRHIEQLEGRSADSLGLRSDDILISTGSQQMLYLIADVLLNPGDIVIAANPSYFVFTGTLDSMGAQVLAVPSDGEGMDVDAVAGLLESLRTQGRLAQVKFVYCGSYYDNPTGLSLSLPRRRRLVEIVRSFSTDHRILILEDAAYRELRYDGEALPSIKSFDPENRYTILTQTFSKPFAPGIKLGYTAVPHDLMHAILQQKGNHDFGSANVCQHIALLAMNDGSYEAHLHVLRSAYGRKRDLMLWALNKHFGGEKTITWTRPHGGMYVWLTLPAVVDTSRESAVFKRSVDNGVLYVPGDLCFHPDQTGRVPRNSIRLSFAQVAAEKIEEAIRRLAEAVKGQMAQAAVGGGSRQ